VSCAYPPIPIRDWDFCVYRDPEKPSTYGWGRTSAEALDDFTRLELEEACYAECGDATDEDSGCQLAARGYGGKCPLRVLEERRAKR
jgi:hypothetical protein